MLPCSAYDRNIVVPILCIRSLQLLFNAPRKPGATLMATMVARGQPAWFRPQQALQLILLLTQIASCG